MYSAACVDATWISLTDLALGSSSPVFDGTSSTMRGGAVGPSFSCVHHAARYQETVDGARYGESGERGGVKAGVEAA